MAKDGKKSLTQPKGRLVTMVAERRRKLQEIRKMGVDPYPAKFKRTHLAGQVGGLKEKSRVVVAGRIMGWREHGGATFADLRDASGKVQVYFQEDKLGKRQYEFLELLDLGDLVGVEGEKFTTKAGEPTVRVTKYQLLTKALRPLPSAWYGLKDVEERYRKRYLDLLLNEEVRKIFRVRSEVVDKLREFLIDKKGYLEVETPVLQPLYGGGLARPFKTYHNALGMPLYLRISTELYLKRLIVGGLEKVFEINRVFRNEGIDKNHNPEFTILETMEAWQDYQGNMSLVEEMFEWVTKEVMGTTKVKYQGEIIDFSRPWKRMTMVEAVREETGCDFYEFREFGEAKRAAEKLGVKLEKHDDSVGAVLAEVFEERVEGKLVQPTFIYDFPVETSPLAKKKADDPRFVERFEHFVAGREMSNNYSELNDPEELAERFRDERKKERLGDEEAHQTDKDFIEAMEYGMPPTSGIGPGIDRYVMVLTNAANLREVILFPTLRPEK